MSSDRIAHLLANWDAGREGSELYQTISELYPICRSITGDGLRESLRLIRRHAPLSLREVPSGTAAFDWTVPKEWNIRDAFIKNARGDRIVDFRQSNLHIVQYSVPVRRKISRDELRPHLFTLPEAPDLIPYRTSYFRETWGFCLSHRQWESLPDEEFEICIDSTLEPGSLTYGELRIQGATDDEILISAHSCHPSLCNDNLSGMAVAVRLAQHLGGASLRYSYRFLWAPGTIGSITWLSSHQEVLPKVKHGLVLSCLGDPGRFHYKLSRSGEAEIDRAVGEVLRHSGSEFSILDFAPSGYDERQYCSPGINLPVGCFMRTPNRRYPQYHTSGDNLTLVTPDALAGSLFQLIRVVGVLEGNFSYLNLNPKCEPQLGRRGLYRAIGGEANSSLEEAILWVLNFSDGAHSLLDIAEKSRLDFRHLQTAAQLLAGHGLLAKT